MHIRSPWRIALTGLLLSLALTPYAGAQLGPVLNGMLTDSVANTTEDSARGYSPGDCNENGIPDECDIDCGAPDGPCDVPGCGESADCNANTVPDECDIDPTDPDGNGEVSTDVNENGVPDECETANPPAPAAAPHDARKNRYISLNPNNADNKVAIEVQLASMKRSRATSAERASWTGIVQTSATTTTRFSAWTMEYAVAVRACQRRRVSSTITSGT